MNDIQSRMPQLNRSQVRSGMRKGEWGMKEPEQKKSRETVSLILGENKHNGNYIELLGGLSYRARHMRKV
jgi:hypothetical protein